MALDLERLENALNEMGYSVEFNSETPGFENADGSITKFDELPLVYNEFKPVQHSKIETKKVSIDKKEGYFNLSYPNEHYRYYEEEKQIDKKNSWRLAC